jgi:hypothetical protein
MGEDYVSVCLLGFSRVGNNPLLASISGLNMYWTDMSNYKKNCHHICITFTHAGLHVDLRIFID